METCKICQQESSFLFECEVLNKHKVSYYQCVSCKFIQTENPFWLDEAYGSAIGGLDIGILHRNELFSNTIPDILNLFTSAEDVFIDYGGGYGIFVRMMRDRGYRFYLYDKYCENLFAKFFEVSESKSKNFAALTAFEVFEHLVDPVSETQKMLEFSKIIIFSTELQPDTKFASENDWWYFVPAGGQHVALYTLDSLKHLALLLGCYLYTNKTNLHILSKVEMPDPFKEKKVFQNSLLIRAAHFIERKFSHQPIIPVQRESLLSLDFEMTKQRLKS